MPRASRAPKRFQSTPPRGRRPSGYARGLVAGDVSIHASAREATLEWFDEQGNRHVSIHASAREATGFVGGHRPSAQVSIHASAREATWTRWHNPEYRSCFNPRLRAGGDPPAGQTRAASFCVSIHASAREATPHGQSFRGRFQVSIHASAREATWSTPTTDSPSSSFNPRLRAGGDGAICQRQHYQYVSIHASAREATRRNNSAWN